MKKVYEGRRKVKCTSVLETDDSYIEDASVGVQPIMDVNGDFTLTCFYKVGLRALSRNQNVRLSYKHCKVEEE